MPVISHETAQFQTYPDFDEIHRYTGVLYPYNLQVFYKRLVQAGMAAQAKDFHRASGLWSLQLYKADVEMDMRTPNMLHTHELICEEYSYDYADLLLEENPRRILCNRDTVAY